MPRLCGGFTADVETSSRGHWEPLFTRHAEIPAGVENGSLLMANRQQGQVNLLA